MSRSLLPVFLVLFLAAAVPASAGPDDLFDALGQGAFQPGQKEFILSLDGGRYGLRDGRIFDARSADPARRLLTNARVAELLAGPSRGSRPDASVAALGDAGYQRAMALVAKSPAPNLNFDGGVSHAGVIRGPPAAAAGTAGAAGAAAPSAPADLQARLLQRLVFKGTKQDREALGEAVGLILKTKTGRELAGEFVKEGAAAELSLGAISNSGETHVAKVPPEVTLSREYLGKEPEYSRPAMAGTLAHELFGHAFEVYRAKKAGLPELARYHYRGDELGARLIDWQVQTELTGTVADANPQEYLDNPEGYYRGVVTRDPYYILTFSPKEMKNPVTTLRGRRKLLAADVARTEASLADNESWRPILAHFVAVHRIPKSRFEAAQKGLDDYLKWATGHQKKLAASKVSLEESITSWSSPEGAKEKRQLIAAADSPYLARFEADLAPRARALRRLRAGRSPSSSTEIEMPPLVVAAPKEPAEAPIDLDELSRMYHEDLTKNPGHWK